MAKIKFRKENIKEQEFAQEVRQRVRDYFKENKRSVYANFNMYLKTVVMLGLYLTPFILILSLNLSPLAALALAFLMGIGEAGIGMSVMHDGAHKSYSSKKWVNNLVASSMYLLGSSVFNWKIQHNIKHHTFTNIFNQDPDISVVKVIRFSEHAPLKKFHRFQQIYAFPLYGLMTFVRLFGEISTLLEYNREGISKEHHVNPVGQLIKLIFIKLIYFVLIIGLPVLFTDFAFWQILIGFVVLHLTAGMIMSTVFQMAHVVKGTDQPMPDENQTIHNDWVVHQMRTTSDFGRKNGLLSWYIGGLDFQIEHHLFQNVCHVHYPAIAGIVKSTAEEFKITYNLNSNIFRALSSHYNRLKELGRPMQSA